jgi:hypothetical protein
LPLLFLLPMLRCCTAGLFTYVRLMKECWAHDPKQRPSFEVIARRLKAMQRWRKIISKHSTLHRAASALRQSSSSSSLTKEGSSKAAAHGGSAAAAVGGGSAATSVLTANGNGGPSTPALSRARSSKLGGAAAAAAVAAENGMPPRAPVIASGAASLPLSGAAAVPEYSSSECDNDSLPEFEDFEDGDAMQYAGSVPVSEAVVAGTRLAVIGVCSHQDERDALASVAGAELSLARKVVLVGSDLPAGTFSRPQAMRGTGMNSLEETRTRRSGGSASASFTAGPQVRENRVQDSRAWCVGVSVGSSVQVPPRVGFQQQLGLWLPQMVCCFLAPCLLLSKEGPCLFSSCFLAGAAWGCAVTCSAPAVACAVCSLLSPCAGQQVPLSDWG